MDKGKRILLKALSVFSVTTISAPLLAGLGYKHPTSTHELFNLALKTWQKSEDICPASYIEQIGINKVNYKYIQKNQFIAGEILELDGLVLSKCEVASLANIALIIKEQN
ncbi:MAG: hypothetical protein HRT51_03235 [Colwellia sp.]|nr:hypothetical protein [Colwellia sp.]